MRTIFMRYCLNFILHDFGVKIPLRERRMLNYIQTHTAMSTTFSLRAGNTHLFDRTDLICPKNALI